MSRKEVRNIGRISGKGKVYKQDTPIADVSYFISIDQEYISPRSTFGGSTNLIPGHKRIEGQLTVIRSHSPLEVGEYLTLLLEDGRKWEFFANRGNPIEGTYDCMNVNSEGLIR